MGEKICLDTDVCIAILNNDPRAEDILRAIVDKPVSVTSMTIFELNIGARRHEKIKEFLSEIPVLYFDETCAVEASRIHNDLRMKGAPLDFRDIFIASMAIINDCTLASFNKRHFLRISNLSLLRIP